VSAFYDQSPFDVRLERGADGVSHLAAGAQVVVIVDVLSFSTAVDVAAGRGAFVYPFGYRGGSAEEFATRIGSMLAVGREQQSQQQPFSLSPGTLRGLHPGDRLVLPSPNGATLSLLAAETGAVVYAGCLRNATAVAAAARSVGTPVTLVAAGERWRNATDSLRPAVEDFIGAGAIAASFSPLRLSPEAAAAVAAFRAAEPCLRQTLLDCSSGRELRERGFSDDVELAAELNASSSAPVLVDGAYRARV
jgi:2-phosphosulfolactate phosphatase